jgi:hypothetical protein
MTALEHKDIVFPGMSLEEPDHYHGTDAFFIEAGMKPVSQKHMLAIRMKAWEATAREYEADPGSFFASWMYLDMHPVFWRTRWHRDPEAEDPAFRCLWLDGAITTGWLEISVHEVKAPGIAAEEGDEVTGTEVWWEIMYPAWGTQHAVHEWELDGGAPTYERAVVSAARAVHDYFGNDRRKCMSLAEIEGPA